jgi:hypothetical protein
MSIFEAWRNGTFVLPMSWQDWAGVATIIQVAFVIFALLYAKRQIEEASQARYLNAITQLLNEIGSQNLRKARNRIYNLTDKPIADASKLEEEFIECVKRVAVAYDRIGFIAKQNLFPSKSLFDFQQDEIERLWNRIEPIILHIRSSQGRPHYCQHFEYLATIWLINSRKKFYPIPVTKRMYAAGAAFQKSVVNYCYRAIEKIRVPPHDGDDA